MDYATAFDAAHGRGETTFEQYLPIAMNVDEVVAPKNITPIDVITGVNDTMKYLKPVVERVKISEQAWEYARDAYDGIVPVLESLVQNTYREGYKAGLEDTLGNLLAHGGHIPETFKYVIPPELS